MVINKFSADSFTKCYHTIDDEKVKSVTLQPN